MLLRGPDAACEVLLGRRPAGARFMPGRYVFPGGSLEPGDERPSGFDETALAPAPAGDCGGDSHHADTLERLPAFVRAALRETWEETGLLLGLPLDPVPAHTASAPLWRAYAAAGLAPAFAAPRLFGQAITPPGLPHRFHARFFLAEGELARGALRGNGELEDLAWVPLAATGDLPLPGVTRRALHRALAARRGAAPPAGAPLLS